ncbi:hypothetical protein TRFO_42070 [Tritrichomonas foetus]|uniref:Importin N-terminal domain-containing protein n=1 Tax=Tritrichomonas foetus TaxID=1144522 RepID=A0A1J4KYZ0_9EUKA|nr:hypothetical protein TRFO_42070 [Tritrichomonas foetus]|eukprot:OHT16080.1 hypothetical protein TRFO_42070 [Tritrichomonas foetus]
MAQESDQINQATAILDNLYNQPENIIIHIQMYTECPDLTLKHHAALAIKRMIVRQSNTPSIPYDRWFEICSQVTNWVIDAIQNDTNFAISRSLCDIAYAVTKFCPNINLEPYYQLANFLLTSPETMATGLYLWCKVFHYDKDKISERCYNLAKELFVISSQSLSSPNPYIRQSALELLDILIGEPSINLEKDEQFLSILNNVILSLTQYSATMFRSQDITPELQVLINLLTCIFECHIQFFDSNSESIIEIAIMAIGDQSIPSDVRILIHSILSSEFLLVSRSKESIISIMNYSLQLCIVSCQENRQDYSYMFPENIFCSLAENEKDIFWEFFRASISSLQLDDIANRQVALLLIKCAVIVMTMEEALCIYLPLTLQLGDAADEALVNACCQTVSEFVTNIPEILVFRFDVLSGYFMKYFAFQFSMKTLNFVIKNISQPPQYFLPVIDVLISLLPQANLFQATEIFYCIKYCLSHVSSPFVEIYPRISQILFYSINLHEEYRSVILQCFGNLVGIAPVLIQNDLPNIVQICGMCMASFLYPAFPDAVTCIKRLVRYLPNTMAQFLPQLIPPMITIINMEIPNTPEMEIESNYENFQLAKYRSIKCLCLIAQEIKEFANQFGPLIWSSTLDLMADYSHLQYAAKIIMTGARLFAQNQCELNIILSQLTNNLLTNDDIQSLPLILGAIQAIILKSPPEEIIEPITMKKIANVFLGASTGLYHGFIRPLTSTIPDVLRIAIFNAFLALIDQCRQHLSSEYEEYYKILQCEQGDPDKLSFSLFIHLFAKIFYYCGDNKLFDLIFAKIFDVFAVNQSSSFANFKILKHIFISLICLFRLNSEKCAPSVDEFIKYITTMMVKTPQECHEFHLACQALYTTIIFVYSLPVDERVQTIIPKINVPRNSEYLPWFGDFFIYASKYLGESMIPIVKKFAVRLFSSGSYVLRQINPEIVQFYFNIFRDIQQPELLELCDFNEAVLNQIQFNLQMCSSG